MNTPKFKVKDRVKHILSNEEFLIIFVTRDENYRYKVLSTKYEEMIFPEWQLELV